MHKRAGRATRIIHRGWQILALELRADLFRESNCVLAELVAKTDLVAATLCMGIDRAFWYRCSQHFLKAECLRTELKVSVWGTPPTNLVFHGEGWLAGAELDEIGFAA